MNMTTIFCLLFILTNSVIAQASTLHGDLGIARIETTNWTTTHAGQMKLDGLDVVAALETINQKIQVPTVLANSPQTLVPLSPVSKKFYRLQLAAVENPALRVRFELEGRTVSVNGMKRFAFISKANNQDFQFLILAHEDGSLQASFTRKLSESEFEEGEFTLAPLAHILQK